MQRKIRFRGKRVNNGEWVYGFYVVDPKGGHRIYLKPFDEATSNTYYFVIPETVGQYTGINDKNGKEIFEGDIISYGVYTTNIEELKGKLCLHHIAYDNDRATFTSIELYDSSDHISIEPFGAEVIGTIHDNK